MIPSPIKISRPLPPLPIEIPAENSVVTDDGVSEPRVDVPDGLVLSCLAEALEAPPSARPPSNPAVANVRAPHILPNLAALRALDLNESQPPNRDSSSSNVAADAGVSSTPAAAETGPPPVTPAPSLRSHLESPKPHLMKSLIENEESLPKYKRDLVAKMKVLRSELSSLQPQSGHCRLEVSRQEIFEDSYRQASPNK